MADDTSTGSPSRDSGALLDAALQATATANLVWTRHNRATSKERRAAGESQKEAVAAIRARLSTLERDAARMREALAGILALANAEAHAVAIHGDEYAFACTVGDRARAALTPSGEPTTTPSSNVQL